MGDVLQKLRMYYQTLNEWLFIKQQNISIADILKEMNYKKVAIYGMKELGQRLYDELYNSEVEVVCVIDQNKDAILGDYEIIGLDDEIPEVDAVIVTAFYYYSEIKNTLKNKVSCPILSLDHIIYNAFK